MVGSRTSSLQKFFGAFLSAALAATVLAISASPAYAAAGDALSGSVFRDEGWDGAKTLDIGEAGIEVVVTDSLGVSTAIYISDGSGNWATGAGDLDAMTGPYRVTFTIPASKAPLEAGPLGTDMRSETQVVNAGDAAVDFGVVNPFHYCQDNPNVTTNCYIEGDQTGGGDVLIMTEYLASGDGTQVSGPGTAEFPIADASDIGSTWGLAIQTFNDRDGSNDRVWAAAMEKRFAGYGPAGPDAIYLVNPATGAVVDSITSVDAGTDQHDWTPVAPGGEIVDAASYGLVGKQGWGDLDLNDVQDRLYAVNLLDRRLYEFNVDAASGGYKSVTNSWSLVGLPGQACSSTIRPWAVGFNEGVVFVGTTCEDGTVAYVHSLDPAGAAFTSELTVDLTYGRQPVGAHNGYLADWNPWTADNVWEGVTTGWGGAETGYPQPMLSDIEFDRDALILGVRDRYGDQAGSLSPSIDYPADPTLYATDSGGDVLRACGDGSGGYILEGGAGCAVTNGGDPVFPAGPGGDEWYDGDNYLIGFASGIGHDEISLGGLAISRPRNDVMMTAYDALDDTFYGNDNHAFSSGLARLDNTTGNKIGQYRVYGNGSPAAPGFGKAAGLGDLEAFCLAAPVEIGNFIWLDANADGIQDPDEEPLAGVVVTLYAADGTTVIDTATTGPDGMYSFTVEPETDYVLGVNPAGASAPVTTVDPTLLKGTFADQGTDELLDSDMMLQPSGEYTIDVTTGEPGQNDYSFDGGFVEANHRVGNLVWLDSDDSGTADDGEPGISGLDVQLFVESGDAPGFDAQDQLFGTTTTDAVGNYWFDGLADETYYVGIPTGQTGTIQVNGGSGLETIDPASLTSSTGINAADSDGDNLDDGDPAAGFLSISGPVAVTDNAEPTGEADSNEAPDRDAEAYVEAQAGVVDKDDSDSNLTVDFGFYPTPRIGGLLWVDGEVGDSGYNDGTADSAESPGTIAGASVELWEDTDNDGLFDPANDTLIDTTTTDASGNYYFSGIDTADYFVAIPISQTGQTIGGSAGDLTDYGSSTGQADVDLGADDVDDGDPMTGYASVSGLFTVDLGDNPTDEGGDFADPTADAAEIDATTTTGFFYTDDNSDLSIDFGFVEIPTYEIGNLVWNDVNNDGIAQDGETGIAGVLVELWEDTTGDGTADTLVTSTNTDSDGKYNFAGLPAGDYVVVIPDDQTTATTPAALDAYQPSSNGIEAAPNDDVDNNTNGANTLTGAGPVGNASGILEVGEGIDFADEPTTEQERSDDATANESPTGEEDSRSNLTVDFGYYALRLGNQVWEDTGAGANEDNGVFDTDELGISGVTIELWDDTDGSGDLDPTNDTLVDATTTDAEGNYWFEGLIDGTNYIVAIPEADNNGATEPLEGLQSSTGQAATAGGADNVDDGAPDQTNNYLSVSTPISVTPGGAPIGEVDTIPAADDTEAEANAAGTTIVDANSDLYVDFGFAEAPTYEIGNLVWNDSNNDGDVDLGEAGIAGVLVELWEDTTGDGNPDTLVTSMSTDASGNYNFAGLPAGDYVVVIPDDQTTATTPTALDPFQPSSNGIESDPNNDVDNNTNGANTLTGAGPVGNASGVLTVGEGTDLADEPTNETDESPTGLRDDRSNLTVDFGYYALRLGNQVWEDTGAGANEDNGVFDTDELGISGVTIELWDDTDGSGDLDPTNDTLVDTTTTDAEGNYRFEGLIDGTNYIVAIPEADNTGTGEPLDGLESSTGVTADPSSGDNGDDGAPDAANGFASVANVVTPIVGSTPTGETDTIPAEDAEAEANAAGAPHLDSNSDLRIDFGFIEPPTYEIGNLVWIDANNDGVAEDGEAGIAGVLVELWEDTTGDGNPDTLVTSMSTDPDGKYNFAGLPAGDYVVVIPDDQTTATTPTALDGFQPSNVGVETDPNDNSDNNANGLETPSGSASGIVTVGDGTDLADEPVDEQERADDPTANESPTGLRDDRSNLSIDFGYYQLSLGNQVWADENNDGVAETTEPDIAGVTVELYVDSDADGQPDDPSRPVDTQLTDAAGLYLFTGLVDGETYVVAIPATEFAAGAPLEDLHSSTPTELNPNDDGDVNDNGILQSDGSVLSGPVTLSVGREPELEDPDNDPSTPDDAENLTVDFGFYGLSIGNQVWLDHDNSGELDNGETGLDGVTVELWEDTTGDGVADTQIDTTTTGASGLYLFDGLPEGDYVVVIPASEFADGEPLDGHNSSTPTELDPNDDADVNDNGVPQPDGSVMSNIIELIADDEPAGEAPDNDLVTPDTNENLTVDFGFYQLRLGNQVWADIGAGPNEDNGVYDSDEFGIENVIVELWIDADGSGDFDPAVDTLVDSTVTDANGNYWFDSLEDDETYIVAIPDAGNADAGEALELTDSSTLTSADPNAADNDDDGAPQDGYKAVSTPVTLDAGSEATGEVDTNDAGSAEDEANAAGTPIPDANSNLLVDFGFVTPPIFEIGNLVWGDDDNNGVINGAEVGIEGVLVELWRDTDNNGVGDVLVDTENTDVDGMYLFDMVFPGDYIVVIPEDQTAATTPSALDNLVSSDVGEEVDPDADVDGNDNGIAVVDQSSFGGPVGLVSGVLTVGEGADLADEPIDETDESPNGLRDDRSNLSVDFGFYGLSLGNILWHDVDNSGTFEPTEPPLPGVIVNLWEDTTGDGVPDTLVGTTTTDSDGNYLFEGLPAGDYVVEVPASEFDEGGPLVGLNPSDNPELDPNTDTDGDNNGSPVSDGSVQTGIIELAAAAEPTAETPSNDPNPQDANSNLTIDLGFYGLTLGNNVFFDTDADGEIDADEIGVEGVVVNLWEDTTGDGEPDTLIATTTTDENGHYLFTGLTEGDYVVELPEANFADDAALDGWVSSTGGAEEADPNNDVDGNDNGVDPADPGQAVLSEVVTLTAQGEPVDETDVPAGHDAPFDDSSNLTVDFGFYNLSLGNRIWDDTNNNGQIDPDETGIAGVVVELYADADSDGQPDDLDGDGEPDPVQTVATDVDGFYEFDGLLPGTYIVGVPEENFVEGAALEGMTSSTPTTADPEDNQDSDDNGIDPAVLGGAVYSLPIVLAANTEPTNDDDPASGLAGLDDDSNLTIDFGFFDLPSAGGTVWIDSDGDGQQDPDEDLVPDVQVQLVDSDGSVVATTTTDASGDYEFVNIAPGTYTVTFVASTFPNGYTPTTVDCGCPDDVNSDVIGPGTVSGEFIVAGGTATPPVSMGLVAPPSTIPAALAFTGSTAGGFVLFGLLLILLGLPLAYISSRRRLPLAITTADGSQVEVVDLADAQGDELDEEQSAGGTSGFKAVKQILRIFTVLTLLFLSRKG